MVLLLLSVVLMLMYKLAITRFDNETYRENREWCRVRDFNGSIYGSPIRISESVLPETVLFVLEMNNSTNKIMGVGMVKCVGDIAPHAMIKCGGGKDAVVDNGKKCKIYSDNNYNRFIYQSKHRIDFSVEYLSMEFHRKIVLLEKLLFKGSRHSKRGQGIQLMPLWVIVEIRRLALMHDIRAILQRITARAGSIT